MLDEILPVFLNNMNLKGIILKRFNAVFLLFLFIGVYWIPLKGIVTTWFTNEDYSYGILIPFVSAYLFWDIRSRLNNVQISSSWAVLPVLIIFYLLSLYGILGSSEHISRPAIPVLIILFAGFCFGTEFVKKFILPLGFLVFMVPLPAILDRTLGLFLKRISSELGGLIIKIFGIPVHVSGNVIDLGVTQLQVVDACSGLRFVFPLFALGIIYAYFFERVTWKRIVCVFSTIPIAILTNGLRIGITGILTDKYGPEMAQGFFHDFSGWVIFMAAFVFLFLIGRCLRLFPSQERITDTSEPVQKITSSVVSLKDKAAFLVSVFLLLTAGGFSWSTSKLPPLAIKGGIQSFPIAFGDWTGYAEPVDPDIILKSGAEEAFNGLYRNQNHEEVFFYMGYRSSAFLESENFFHSPTVCLPGHGWENKETSSHQIADVPFFKELTVTKMIVENEGIRQLVYFWFQTKDRSTPDKNIHRFHLARHAIQRDNTHALFIRPITPVKSKETITDAEKRMDMFVREMMPVLIDFLQKNQFERIKE